MKQSPMNQAAAAARQRRGAGLLPAGRREWVAAIGAEGARGAAGRLARLAWRGACGALDESSAREALLPRRLVPPLCCSPAALAAFAAWGGLAAAGGCHAVVSQFHVIAKRWSQAGLLAGLPPGWPGGSSGRPPPAAGRPGVPLRRLPCCAPPDDLSPNPARACPLVEAFANLTPGAARVPGTIFCVAPRAGATSRTAVGRPAGRPGAALAGEIALLP